MIKVLLVAGGDSGGRLSEVMVASGSGWRLSLASAAA